jgi:hypothetical protein
MCPFTALSHVIALINTSVYSFNARCKYTVATLSVLGFVSVY